MKSFLGLAGMLLAPTLAGAVVELRVEGLSRDGRITWSGAYTAGVCTIQSAPTPAGPWTHGSNYFTSNWVGGAWVVRPASNTFYRLLAVDISTNSPRHYTNLLEAYGILETVAGKGDSAVDSSQWRPEFEGAWATNVNLSRPHIAFGDPWGNVLIVDQRSSSVLKVTPEGRLYTYAGTHNTNFNGDGPDWATNLNLSNPNGGWMRADGTFYILDTANNRVRKVTTNQMMSTLFVVPSPLGDGRALWVKSDETLAYFGSGTTSNEWDPASTATILKRWTPTTGVTVVRSDFRELGNIVGDERTGDLYIADRGANRVYRMDPRGTLTPIAGNGTTSGGGDGHPALQTGLIQPRCVAFLPNGGFFVCEHSPGNRIWYVDPGGIIRRWMNGSDANHKRVGDGEWFYANPDQPKVSRVRSVIPDPFGNLIITESNFGYVRRIRFQRVRP